MWKSPKRSVADAGAEVQAEVKITGEAEVKVEEDAVTIKAMISVDLEESVLKKNPL